MSDETYPHGDENLTEEQLSRANVQTQISAMGDWFHSHYTEYPYVVPPDDDMENEDTGGHEIINTFEVLSEKFSYFIGAKAIQALADDLDSRDKWVRHYEEEQSDEDIDIADELNLREQIMDEIRDKTILFEEAKKDLQNLKNEYEKLRGSRGHNNPPELLEEYKAADEIILAINTAIDSINVVKLYDETLNPNFRKFAKASEDLEKSRNVFQKYWDMEIKPVGFSYYLLSKLINGSFSTIAKAIIAAAMVAGAAAATGHL